MHWQSPLVSQTLQRSLVLDSESTFSGTVVTISVAMKPGATALTVIPFLPNSLAHTFVIPMTSRLCCHIVCLTEVPIERNDRRGIHYATVVPRRPYDGTTDFVQLNTPFRLTSMTWSNCSAVIFTSVASRVIPALLMRISILP